MARPEGAPAESPHELRYQHFSVFYSGLLKTPVIAALNLDGSQMRVVKSRAGWRKDPRIPADLQLGAADYDAAAIDRGHLVRREATNWGTQAEAEQADDDSFHYTVCSPQHVEFNRSPGIWLQIEDHVLRHSRTHGFRVNVMVGPILTGDEPPLGTSGASLPLAYFKVLSMLAEDATGTLRLHATGYVLSQGQLIQKWLAGLGRTEGTEGFAFGAFKTFQVRIADIEAETGHDFGPLSAADPLAAAIAAEGPDSRPFRPLDRAEDLLL
jgi:endonuclease G